MAYSTIRGILKNEKYKGDVLQGKTYITDPISHRRVVNMGEENQYYIQEHMSQLFRKECLIKHKKFYKSEEEYEVLEEEKEILVENILLVVEYIVDSVEVY